MSQGVRGSLIIIGGKEEKESGAEREILSEVARRAEGGRLVIMPLATDFPEEVGREYVDTFGELGVSQVRVLQIENRAAANDPEHAAALEGASLVFFPGGDQLRITSRLGGSPVGERLRDMYQQGLTIAGTSAGAAAMPTTMLIGGNESFALSEVQMAPGLGLLDGVVTDSHFAQRGRFGRLLGAVAANPVNLGLGIDEDTAAIVDHGTRLCVLGSGNVYVVDGSRTSSSSLTEGRPSGSLSIFDVALHVLAAGDEFDLGQRRPVRQAPV